MRIVNMKICPLYIILLAAALLFSTSCAEKKEVPDPPLTRSKILLEMFDALEKGDHQTAFNKITKLRELDKTNIFLAKLENLEKNNVCIASAQSRLDKNETDNALLVIEKGIIALGRNEPLLKAKDDILKFKTIPRLLNSLNNPLTASRTAKDAVKLRELLVPYPKILKLYTPYIKECINLAYQLERNEKWIYVSDLCDDINSLLEKADPDAHSLLAQLAVESPRHPLVSEYAAWLNSDPKNQKFDPLLQQKDR